MDWTHAACLPCYQRLHPGRQIVRVVDAKTEPCCVCGQPAGDGIYVRADPSTLRCEGVHAA